MNDYRAIWGDCEQTEIKLTRNMIRLNTGRNAGISLCVSSATIPDESQTNTLQHKTTMI
jgi:hypothetical protein